MNPDWVRYSHSKVQEHRRLALGHLEAMLGYAPSGVDTKFDEVAALVDDFREDIYIATGSCSQKLKDARGRER